MGDPLGVNNLTTKLMIENRQSSEKFVAGLARLSAFGATRCRPPGSCGTCGSREAEVGQEEAFDIDAEIVDNWYLPLSLRLVQNHAQRRLSASLDHACLAAFSAGAR
ncbi:hypothetical protein PQR52_29825 [Paraburkholderia aspalathi]|uniref:hypothetical protein n=1 Tax=Paraburkholderia aspalathi TaxID=1324617 RepID=UPI0038BDE0D1